MVGTFESIIIGRLLHGITAGSAQIVLAKILTDTIPNSVTQQYAIATNTGCCMGIMLAGLISALIMPIKEDGTQVLLANELWRVVYAAPILMLILVMLVI